MLNKTACVELVRVTEKVDKGGVEKKLHQQPQKVAVGANFFQRPLVDICS